MSKNNLTYRVSQLEKSYDKLDEKMDSLLSNHLPGIEKEIISLKTRVSVATLFNVGAIVLGIILSRYL